jgi:hypothetical protein
MTREPQLTDSSTPGPAAAMTDATVEGIDTILDGHRFVELAG